MTDDPNVYQKGWGYERWLHNEDNYCMKLLCFRGGGRCSMHFHLVKRETWYVASGEFEVDLIMTNTGDHITRRMRRGDFQTINPGFPHRITCTSSKGGTIVEASTKHLDSDSYRIAPGDSQEQCKNGSKSKKKCRCYSD